MSQALVKKKELFDMVAHTAVFL